MPAAVAKKRRRLMPCRRASGRADFLRRASTSRCCAVCGAGTYSSLDTIWVGIGALSEVSSAGAESVVACLADHSHDVAPVQKGCPPACHNCIVVRIRTI